MKETAKSILEVAHGEILKKTDYELSKILANINDVNTSDKAKRKLNITITLQPINDRENVIMTCDVKSSLSPINPTEIILTNSERVNDDGEVINILQEVSKQARGQLNLNGEIFEPEVVLIGMGADKLVKKEEVQKD